MKRSVMVMGLVLFLAVMLTAGVLSAREPITKGGATAPPGSAPQGRLPDFTIDKIYLTKDCRVAVVVKNLGPGVVPDEVWTVHTPKSAGVYLYRNGTGWGGASIWKFDPAKNLKAPGGTATYTSTLQVTGSAAIKAVVDLWNVVAETNEGNNSLEVKLACEAQPGPCCIAGKYEGTTVDDPTCPVGPESGKFTLILKQTNCGSPVQGDILDPATGAVTSKLKGTVTSGPGKCCTLVGRVKGEPGTDDAACLHEVKATLCKNALGKWYVTDGVYTDLSGKCCSGKFKMEQL
jgi:hypothetical protein